MEITSLDQIRDLQAETPAIPLPLDWVGVRGVARGAMIDGAPATVTFDVEVTLDAGQRGVHMSRFHEALDASLPSAPDTRSLVQLAHTVADAARTRQNASRARVRANARLIEQHPTPVSGNASRDPFDATVVVEASDARPLAAAQVSVTGITACPCAQNLVRDAARTRLATAGHDDAAIDRIFELVPVATHNQRSTATLQLTTTSLDAIDLSALAGIARSSMSARVHELLKRDDERALVEAAHANPRFVEDCVRDAVSQLLDCGLPLCDDDHIHARQVNFESIHAHDAVADVAGTVATLRTALKST